MTVATLIHNYIYEKQCLDSKYIQELRIANFIKPMQQRLNDCVAVDTYEAVHEILQREPNKNNDVLKNILMEKLSTLYASICELQKVLAGIMGYASEGEVPASRMIEDLTVLETLARGVGTGPLVRLMERIQTIHTYHERMLLSDTEKPVPYDEEFCGLSNDRIAEYNTKIGEEHSMREKAYAEELRLKKGRTANLQLRNDPPYDETDPF